MDVRVFISVAYRKWSQILLRCIMKRQDPMDTTLTAVRNILTSYKEKNPFPMRMVKYWKSLQSERLFNLPSHRHCKSVWTGSQVT